MDSSAGGVVFDELQREMLGGVHQVLAAEISPGHAQNPLPLADLVKERQEQPGQIDSNSGIGDGRDSISND